MYYIHKHQVHKAYGGPEEGGWWYDVGHAVLLSEWDPAQHPYRDQEEAYASSRVLNDYEYQRRVKEEDYAYDSVLADQSTHYAYSVEDFPEPYDYPETRPHYE